MKLLIADDHTLFRDTLKQYIERANPDAKVTISKDFTEAYRILKGDSRFDLVIFDIKMPGMNGLEGFDIIKREFPELRAACMSGVAEEDQVRDALRRGAVGYFPKTLSGKSLVMAIDYVLKGNVFIPEDVKRGGIMPSYIVDDSEKAKKKALADMKFTGREMDVLLHLVAGATNKEIASALNLQIVTIKLHVRGICRKLGAQNRTQAALIAREIGVKSTKA